MELRFNLSHEPRAWRIQRSTDFSTIVTVWILLTLVFHPILMAHLILRVTASSTRAYHSKNTLVRQLTTLTLPAGVHLAKIELSTLVPLVPPQQFLNMSIGYFTNSTPSVTTMRVTIQGPTVVEDHRLRDLPSQRSQSIGFDHEISPSCQC